MAQDRVNGTVVADANQGYQPVVIKVAAVAGFLVDTVAGDGAITKNGYSKAVDVLETFGSIVWVGAQTNNSFTCIVDGGTVNRGVAADYAELAAAMELIIDAGTAVVTTSEVLNGDGTFTYA
jgi:hypothetical protein